MNTVREALIEATKLLADLETPFLDASLLLAHTLGISREKLLASYPEELPLSAQNEFKAYVSKRLSGYPVSYIRKKKEFFGLPYYVDERVLVPRPETETLVELVLQHADTIGATNAARPAASPSQDGPLKILDIGTGSGCIAITLKYLRPELDVTAADTSKTALAVASLNSTHLLSEPVDFVESNLFSAITGTYDVIVSNPPYLTDTEVKEMQRRHWPEPQNALDGGVDGLDIVKDLIVHGFDHLKQNGTLFMEVGIEQIETVRELLEQKGYRNVRSYKDLTGRDRVVSGHKPYVKQD